MMLRVIKTSNLKWHFKEVHGNTFGIKGSLEIHSQAVHENVKPFTCLICNQSFGQKGYLKIHSQTVHENVKPFTCLICKQSFGQKGCLERHTQAVHENFRPFTCLICNQTFRWKGSLKSQIQMVHENVWTLTLATNHLDKWTFRYPNSNSSWKCQAIHILQIKVFSKK